MRGATWERLASGYSIAHPDLTTRHDLLIPPPPFPRLPPEAGFTRRGLPAALELARDDLRDFSLISILVVFFSSSQMNVLWKLVLEHRSLRVCLRVVNALGCIPPSFAAVPCCVVAVMT